jgi:hypothetical protein
LLTNEEASALLSDATANYSAVIRRYLVGEGIVDDPFQSPGQWAIDFAQLSLEEASRFPRALQIVRERVKPERDGNRDARFRQFWWRWGRPRGEMREAIRPLSRYLAGIRTGKRPLFVWCENDWCPSDALNVFALEEDFHLGVLSSTAHTAWAWARSSTLRRDLRYTPTTAFATFPWPESFDEDLRVDIGRFSQEMIELRSLHCIENRFGLTRLYNLMSEGGFRDLANCHLHLDRAVTKAYGWQSEISQDPVELVKNLSLLNRLIVDGRPYHPFPHRRNEIGTFSEDPGLYQQ